MNEQNHPPREAALQAKFEIEKNAKNKAYAFIIAAGLLEQFSEFCKAFQEDTEDWHKVATTLLASGAIK